MRPPRTRRAARTDVLRARPESPRRVRGVQRALRQRLTLRPPAPSAEQAAAPATPSPTADDVLTTQAAAVQHCRRFHGTPDMVPSAKALTQARTLLARYGLEQARHLVDFSYTAAQETRRPAAASGMRPPPVR